MSMSDVQRQDEPRLERLSEHLFAFRDTCNVYLLTDGDLGLVVDAGSGSVLDVLDDTGVRRIEWVLHTHHHRDQTWGTPRLRGQGARVAVPEYERHFFDEAEAYWQTRRTFDNYNCRNTFFTIGENIEVDAILEDYEEFSWRSYRFQVVPAKGHTLGSSMLVVEVDGRRIAFTGDLIAAGGHLYQLHAMEYAYGAMEGVVFTLQSIQALRKLGVDVALPSHGDAIYDVKGDIERLERGLMECVRLGTGMNVVPVTARELGRSLPETSFLPGAPLEAVSRHLLWGGPWTCSNFYVILSESGKALFIDYGHAFFPHMHVGPDHEGPESMRFVEHHVDELFDRYGVECFDLVIPTHIHDDHTVGVPYLQRHHGTRCWALEEVAQVLENPSAWASTPCVLPRAISIERRLRDGETFEWEEYQFAIHHSPGQTEFASTVVAEIDGRKVAFTGDNYFLHDVVRAGTTDRLSFQTTVLRNSFQLAMHRRCAELMRQLSPELICPGHGDPLPCTKHDVDDYCDFIARKERVFRMLVGTPADHFIDLFWARLLPYVTRAAPRETVAYTLKLRNNLERTATFGARLLLPKGWRVGEEPGPITLDAGCGGELIFEVTAPEVIDPRRRLVTADVTIDGGSQGPICEALASVVAA